jgi:hypothetical protein
MDPTNPMKIVSGTYRFLMAAKGIYDNYQKLSKTLTQMMDGGLGLNNCDSMGDEIIRLNAELEAAHATHGLI